MHWLKNVVPPAPELVSMIVAISFLLALFITPIIAIIPSIATTSALVMIGVFMMQGVADLDLRDVKVAAVALVTLLLMTLTRPAIASRSGSSSMSRFWRRLASERL
jgi:xanthine/uracil/vitamin C permease (AzgA family)